MNSKSGMIIILVILIILLWNYRKTKVNANTSESSTSKIVSLGLEKNKEAIRGSWLGGVIVIVDDLNDSMCMNVCYRNKNEHNTTSCHIVEEDKDIIKLTFATAVLLPYISDKCTSMVYDKLNDVLVYKGRNIKDSLFGESRFVYNPTEIFVVVGRDSIQVLHTWSNTVVNSLRIDGHVIDNIDNSNAFNYGSNYQRFMNSVFPTDGDAVVDCSTNIFDSLIFSNGKAYNKSNYIDKCEGPWLGGSLHIKRINDNSYEFCNIRGNICSYARTEGNRFILNPTNDLIKGENKDNRICNSLYYCPMNDLIVWYGDPCLKNYSDLDNDINSDIYMIIKRNELIFYIGNADAINKAGPRLEEVNEVFNPMNVLIRPDI